MVSHKMRLGLVVGLVLVGFVLAGCSAGRVSWGEPASDLADAGDRVVAVAPEIGRTAGTLVGGTVAGPAGATVGGDLGEWITKGVLSVLGIGGVIDGQRQRKKRGQAEADKREAQLRSRESEARRQIAEAVAAKAA